MDVTNYKLWCKTSLYYKHRTTLQGGEMRSVLPLGIRISSVPYSRSANGLDQTLEFKEECQVRLNFKNYIKELHSALIKECSYNLLNLNTLDLTLDFESLTSVNNQTLKAIKDQKIFSVLGYFPTISLELKNRGWVEKRDPTRPPINYLNYLKSAPYMVNWLESPPLKSSINKNDDALERLKNMQSWTILKNKKSDFIFVTKKQLINWATLSKLTSISQMPRHIFCTKDGLAQCLEYHKNSLSSLMFPRCHYIRSEADSEAFVEDYITTALVSTLKIIVQAIENNKMIFTENGNIPYKIIDFVKLSLFKFLNMQKTGNTETGIWKLKNQKKVWNEFMFYYSKLIIDSDAKFDHEYIYELELDVYAKCKYLLGELKTYCPQYYIDGITNTWIIKPTLNCSGHGIMLSRDLHTIKQKITVANVFRKSYVLQKYIERPLLVYTCKIDLRQWFLVTNMRPVVVWMYKEGYVRFCANTFSMKKMDESIHLSNVRLQTKYRKIRNPLVPDECMWNYSELQDHLRKIGQEYVWDELIFPGMCECVYAVLQAATDTTVYRDKTFQLFGADFLITENFIPYLIEINSTPGLNPSTSVIANLAPMLLSDIVKVTVDYEKNSKADTGLFVKVVPEKCKPAAAAVPVETPNFTDSSVVYAVGPAALTTDYNERMASMQKNLAEMRLQMVARKTERDTRRYVGVNRDLLLGTAEI
ncbi:PREDICTED: tubulin glycylase 3A-like [Diuraphis noxia]|uniref:tubulin glycylase 3A-like n=1 Tax=Diuraphis noxia TaxID=143948 RepID=UPI00076390C4|nr:PREDICTED: tubulin glycylase 3A-like [Diuraphis noxia]